MSDTPGTAPSTLVAAFRRQVRERAAEPAMYVRDDAGYRAIDWATFGRDAETFASYLLQEGVAEQGHVAIWSNNRPEWHVSDAAILSLRARPVPVYQTLSAPQAGYVLGHSETTVAVVETPKQAAAVLENRDSLPALRRVVVLEGLDRASDDDFVIPWTAALAQGGAALDTTRAEIERRAESVTGEDIATLIYTSGTTGPPKAVMLTHDNIVATNVALDSVVETGADDRVISYLPLAHIAERQVSEFRSYMNGNPVYFLDGIPHLGERLGEVHPTVFFAVPRVWEKMAQAINASIDDLPRVKRAMARWALKTGAQVVERDQEGRTSGPLLRLKHAIAERAVLGTLREKAGLDQLKMAASGAAPISTDVLRFFGSFGVEICEVYGQTEDTGITTINRPGQARFGTVGGTLPGIDVRLADDGEILVRGPNVFAGYYKDAEATAEAMADGWLHTGDVGVEDGAGNFRIVDRKKDLIITAGGKNISPTNIEKMLEESDLIGQAVAIGDARRFMSALVTLDPDGAARWARQNGVSGGLGEVAQSALARVAVEAHVRAVNARLSQVEQIKRVTILPGEFTPGDELTPTLKVKRKVVAQKYAAEIDAMYTGSTAPDRGVA